MFTSLPYLKDNYKLIAIDLSKQQGLDADQVAIQQINFTGNQGQAGNKTMSFVLQQVKETTLHFSQGSVRVFWICFINLFYFDIISI